MSKNELNPLSMPKSWSQHTRVQRIFCQIFDRKKKNFLQSKNICTRYCSFKHCSVNIKFNTCGSNSQPIALHPKRLFKPGWSAYGEEKSNRSSSQSTLTSAVDLPTSCMTSNSVSSMCTTFCGDTFKRRSCTILVDVYHNNFPESAVRMYAFSTIKAIVLSRHVKYLILWSLLVNLPNTLLSLVQETRLHPY